VNVWQIVRQLKYLLLQRKWEGSGSDVFQDNSVVITVAPDEQALAVLIPPIALIRPLGAQSDPMHDEEPDLILQSIAVRLSVTVPGDPLGQSALIGGGRQSQTDSRGRGLLEVEEELYASIGSLNTINGVVIYSRAKSEAEAELDEDNRYSCIRSYLFEALATSDRFYHPVMSFAAADAVASGDCNLTWTPAPTRFDSRGIRILRIAGGTPVTSPTDGGATVVLSGSAFPGSPGAYTDSPGAGQVSYTIWVTYDEYDSGTTERYSSYMTSTVTVT
tara:strand:- start:415 stop:1239 length:825 start_codon:yes stop_codon:yes gene_type:complete